MMFCRYCGNNLPNDAAFCSNCGAKIVTQQQAQQLNQQGYQQSNGQGYQKQGRSGPDYANVGAKTKAPKKKGGVGKLLLTAAAGVVGVTVAAKTMGGFGNLPEVFGIKPAYESTANPGNGGTSGQKKVNPVSGGKIVAVDKPLIVLGETGNPYYELISGLEQYGKDVAKHMVTPPFNNEIQINGDKITVKLPMVGGFKFTLDNGTEQADVYFFRDEITLHGTITDYGQAREGDGYHDETAQGRPLYYAAGVITGIDSILDGGAFSSKWVEPKSDGHEHLTLTGMGENRRNGETNKFSKFVLNYYPDDGFYQMFIFLFGNKEKECYYPGWDEDRYEKVVEVPYPYGEYDILLVSDFDARMGGPKDEGSWY